MSSERGRHRRRASDAVLLAALAAAAFAAVTRGASPRFYPDDPIWVDDDRVADASLTQDHELDNYYDFIENTFVEPGDRRRIQAVNVNTVDEVPDSSWFVNRIGRRPMSLDEVVRGPDRPGATFSDAWTITRGKSRGFQPGFRAVDRSDPSGQVYQLEFDSPRSPELATAAEVIGTAFYHAFGYHVVDVYLVEVDPAKLDIDPEASVRDANGRRPFDRDDLDEVLRNAARLPSGRIRALASRFAEGEDVGNFEYHGTRPDDPNDVYPHEHRRELRGSRVFAAWLNHDDSRAVNTLVMREERDGRKYLKHYMFDFGSALGSATRFGDVAQSGHEHLLEARPAWLTALTMGLWVRPWLRIPSPDAPPAAGRFTAEGFTPEQWVAEYGKVAYDNMRPDDAFWAARIVSKFSPAMIRGIVGKARYADPRTADHMVETLLQRRDRVLESWLTAVTPIVDPDLSADGVLTFENSAVEAAVAEAPDSYTYAWSRFDNATDTHAPVGEAVTRRDASAQAPLDAFRGAEYVSVSIAANDPAFPHWKPVRAYFRRTADGWQPVGLDRQLD